MEPGREAGGSRFAQLPRFAGLVLLFVLFLGAIDGLGEGFKGLGSGLLDGFFQASANPFVGLIIGILATTLVQSSSVTSSLIVSPRCRSNTPSPW